MKEAKKKIAILVTGIGQVYFDYSKKMLASLLKTNPKIKEKADIVLMTDKAFAEMGGTPFEMFYMTPWFAKSLMKDYECVVRIDSDAIVTGDISSCWESEFDVAVAQNANPREIQAQQQLMGRVVGVWDIKPLEEYVNCGFVVMKSEAFVDHWLKLCTPERRNVYQFYEQDFLNILCYYGNYKVKFLDKEPDNKFWGLSAKGYGSEIIIKDQKLILPKNSGTEIDPWPTDNDKEIVFWHFAGGNQPNKFDKLDTQFSKEVADYLKFLISDEQKA